MMTKRILIAMIHNDDDLLGYKQCMLGRLRPVSTVMGMRQNHGCGSAVWVEGWLLFWALKAALKIASRLRCIESAIWGS